MHVRRALVAATAALWIPLSFAAEIFPRPLHITRVIEDPLANSRTTIDEYLVGNVMISIAGARTAIFDYATSRITIIDRAAGTYSISSFEEFAASRPAPAAQSSKRRAADQWAIAEKGTEIRAGRRSAVREAREAAGGASRTIRVAADPAIELTAEGFDVVSGARYPMHGDEVTSVLRDLSAPAGAAASKRAAGFALPLQTVITYADGADELRLINEVTRVVEEAPSAKLTEIPRGARKVDSPFLSLQRQLAEIDALPERKR